MNLDDLNLIRSALAEALVQMQATDLANAQMNLSDVRYRPLTNLVGQAFDRVEGLIAEHLLERYKEDADAPTQRDAEGNTAAGSGGDHADSPAGEAEEEGEQLRLFDPAEYDAPPVVKAARKKYRMLADDA